MDLGRYTIGPMDPGSDVAEVLLRVPEAMVDEELLAGLESSVIVPRLRGGDLALAITVALDVVGTTSGVVTFLIARDELAEFGGRLVRRLRRLGPRAAGEGLTLHLKLQDQDFKVVVDLKRPEQDFVQAVVRLVKAAAQQGPRSD